MFAQFPTIFKWFSFICNFRLKCFLGLPQTYFGILQMTTYSPHPRMQAPFRYDFAFLSSTGWSIFLQTLSCLLMSFVLANGMLANECKPKFENLVISCFQKPSTMNSLLKEQKSGLKRPQPSEPCSWDLHGSILDHHPVKLAQVSTAQATRKVMGR